MSRSPIHALIDQACGIAHSSIPPESPPKRTPTEADKQRARSVARNAVHHVDEMYPKMWEGVPKTARTSLQNTIYNQVLTLLSHYESLNRQ